MWLPDCLASCFCIFSRIKGLNTEFSSKQRIMVPFLLEHHCLHFAFLREEGCLHTGAHKLRPCVWWEQSSKEKEVRERAASPSLARVEGVLIGMSCLCVACLVHSPHYRASRPLLLLTLGSEQPYLQI